MGDIPEEGRRENSALAQTGWHRWQLMLAAVEAVGPG